jgi:DNA-binding CsgD family transcriptional regulator
MAGRPRELSPIGTVRRIHALVALGHTMSSLAQRLGVTQQSVNNLAKIPQAYVRRSTAERIAALYDELSMQLPDESTPTGRKNAAYARTVARKRGWRPPLAWDDRAIDDPDARPYAPARQNRPGHPETATATLEDFEWLIRSGESPEQAANRLGVTLATIERYRLRVAARLEAS